MLDDEFASAGHERVGIWRRADWNAAVACGFESQSRGDEDVSQAFVILTTVVSCRCKFDEVRFANASLADGFALPPYAVLHRNDTQQPGQARPLTWSADLMTQPRSSPTSVRH